MAPATAEAAPSRSAVYCLRERPNLTVFAAKILADGRLQFGLSVWRGERQIGEIGVARRRGDHWEYRRDMEASRAVDRCRLSISFPARGGPGVAADPAVNCEAGGGQGAYIGSIRIPPRAYQGPVKDELNGKRDFGSVGDC